MASVAEAGQAKRPHRRVMLPFLIVAAAFGIVEFAIESIPGMLFVKLNLDSQSPSVIALYQTVNAAVRASLVPAALFLAFYLLCSRRDVDLRRSYLAMALSIFIGTILVFLPIDVGQAAAGAPSPGFTAAGAVIVSIGGAISSSLNHTFIGFSAVFLWVLLNRPPGTAPPLGPGKRLHGTEDVSLVGVVMVAVFVWEYLAQAYQATYLLGVKNPPAALLAAVLGGGSPLYYTVAVWQQILLLMALPFLLYFLIARKERLNPFLQARKIAIVILLWGLFLRTFTSYSYVYFAQLFDPTAFPGANLASTISSELAPMNLIGILASSFAFLFLGMTAVVFGYFSRPEAIEATPPAPVGGAHPLGLVSSKAERPRA